MEHLLLLPLMYACVLWKPVKSRPCNNKERASHLLAEDSIEERVNHCPHLPSTINPSLIRVDGVVTVVVRATLIVVVTIVA